MNISGEFYSGMIDPHEAGKHALVKIADLGATRAGKLILEIKDNIWKLNQKGVDNEYLKHHLDALFTEFISGEDYDLQYYNKPEEPKLNSDNTQPDCDQVKITSQTIRYIKDANLHHLAAEALYNGEKNWIDKRHMSDDWIIKNSPPLNAHHMNDPNCKCSSCKSTSSRIKITFDNIHQIKEMEDFDRALGMLYRKEEVWIGRDQMMQDEYDVS